MNDHSVLVFRHHLICFPSNPDFTSGLTAQYSLLDTHYYFMRMHFQLLQQYFYMIQVCAEG